MGTCVEKLPCEDCGSSDSRQAFYNEIDDNFTSFCFGKCYALKGDPYTNGTTRPEIKTKDKNQIFNELQEIKSCHKMPAKHRGIPAKYLQKWGVRQLISEYNGKVPYATSFGYSRDGKLVEYKTMPFNKKAFWFVGNDPTTVDPYGLERALKNGAKRLYITEGEWDAISLDYALTSTNENTKYSHQRHSIISLPHGWGSMSNTLSRIRTRIKVFDEIVLVMDDDECGRKAEKVAQRLYPDVLRTNMPQGCKDPNEAVQKGLIQELVRCVRWNAHKPPIKGVIQVSEVMKKVLEKPVMGLSYPYPQLTELTLGQRFKECCGIGAGVSIGKTTLAHEWSAHNIIEHKMPCFLILLEEENHVTVQNVAGKIDSIPYHRPDMEEHAEQLMETAQSLDGKLLLWESNEDQALRFDMDEIIEAIRFNTNEYGCRFHYIDNLTRLVDHLSASDANEFINKYSSELEGLCAQLDIHVDVFSHLNNTEKITHENGGPVQLNQFTGSRGLMRSFPMMIGFERNKNSGINSNNSIIRILKNRKYGNEGFLKTKYNSVTGRLLESEWLGSLIEEKL